MKNSVYKFDGTDSFKIYPFKIGLYEREEILLKKKDFNGAVFEHYFTRNEKLILQNLIDKGFLYSSTINGERFYEGTSLYEQWLDLRSLNE